MLLLHLTPVPDFTLEDGRTVPCGRRLASLAPDCNAVGYYDRLVLRPLHMHREPTFHRLPACAAANGTRVAEAPVWCTMRSAARPHATAQAHPSAAVAEGGPGRPSPPRRFEAMGLLSTVSAVATSLLGAFCPGRPGAFKRP